MPIDINSYDFWAGETLLIDKPLGWTSFDVVNKVRLSISKTQTPRKKIKVGHAGTLDPLATGLLIVCTGKNTKKISSLQALTKEYTGTITIGATRPSYDMETEIDQTFDYDAISNEDIENARQQFLGKIEQFPPIFSAIKVGGKPMYLAARKGKSVEIKARNVEIQKFEITNVQLPSIDFKIVCSKGTYIRSIAYDFGKALNNGGYLSALTRTGIGGHRLEDAWNLENFIELLKKI